MKIAVVRLTSLGDIAQTMIVVQFIRKNYPNASIDWYVDTRFIEIVKLNSDINNIYSIGLRDFKSNLNFSSLIKDLKIIRKNNEYDILFDFQGLLKSALISRLIKAKKRVGFSRESCKESSASLFYDIGVNIPYNENVYKRYTQLVSKVLEIEIDDNSIRSRERYLLENKNFKRKSLIGIFVGSSNFEKLFPIEGYVNIINTMNKEFLLIWGNENERKVAEKIQSLSRERNVLISEKLSLSGLTKVINSLELILAGDTGPLYIAWACKIPSIGLFGPTDSLRTFFPTEKNLAFQFDFEALSGRTDMLFEATNEIKDNIRRLGVS